MGVRIPVRVNKQASRSESGIQREVLDALRKMGKFALRLNSGKVKVRGGWMQLCSEGTPDIEVIETICVSFGGTFSGPTSQQFQRVTWIEMKDAKGKQRGAQIAFEYECTRRGERYILARSLDDVLAALK